MTTIPAAAAAAAADARATETLLPAPAPSADPAPAPAADDAPAAPRRRRPLPWGCIGAWAVALLIPLLLLAAVVLPWWLRLHELDVQRERSLDQLHRYQRLVATLPGLRAELAREQANDDFKAFYFDAETPALAGARLQSEVQEMVRSAGARPISTQILPADQDEQPPRVRIRTQLQGSTDQLLDVLYRIESARPFLFVDQLSIRSTTPRAAPVRRGVARRTIGREVGELTVRLDIFGFILGGGQ